VPIVGSEELARALNLTPQRIRQLAAEGIITRLDGGKYDLGPSVGAYLRYLQGLVSSRGNPSSPGSPKALLTDEKLRSTRLDNEVKEMELARLRRESLAVADHARRMELRMGRLAARVKNWAGQHAHETVRLPSIAESLVVWERVQREALMDLQGTADEPDPDDAILRAADEERSAETEPIPGPSDEVEKSEDDSDRDVAE